MLDFFSLVIALIALIVARKTFNQVAALRARLDLMQTLAQPTAAPSAPPPLTPLQALEEMLATSSPTVPQPPPLAPEPASVASASIEPEVAADNADASTAPPPPLPQPAPGFEETIGTRWVVWIGGLTLALR